MTLKYDERLDYVLGDGSIQIIQSSTVFSFSMDAVLLADFVYVPIKRGNILDLCTGNGVIPLLLTKRTNAAVTGVEIQERIVDMAKRNVALNGLEHQLTMLHGDLRKMDGEIGQGTFDVVTCNPPYFRTPAKTEHNANEYLTIARHEVMCTLEDVIAACKWHVRPGGKVALVHRPERLVDLIMLFREYNIEPKRLRFVYPKDGREANMLLIEGIRDGNRGVRMLPPLYVYNSDGDYTKEAGDIIYGNK